MQTNALNKFFILTIMLLAVFIGSHLIVRAEVEVGFENYLPTLYKPSICDIPSPGYPTIQSGVDDANCEILNLTAGIYIENVTVSSRTITILGQGPAVTVVDGNAAGSVFYVADNASLTLEGVTVTNGKSGMGAGIMNYGNTDLDNTVITENDVVNGPGGGIASLGDLTVENSWFINNAVPINSTVGQGGAIYIRGAVTVQITSTVFDGNMGYDGGGIYVLGFESATQNAVVTISDSEFKNNRAASGGGIRTSSFTTVNIFDSIFRDTITGRAIKNGGDMQIIRCHIINNDGGGIYNSGISSTDDGVLVIDQSEIRDNSAGYNGGGIYNEYGDVQVLNSLIAGNNTVENGGGIFNNSYSNEGVMLIDHSEFRDNNAGENGGGIYNNYGDIQILNSLIVGNKGVENGGGFYNISENPALVENSTFFNNTTDGSGGGIFASALQLVNVTINQNSALGIIAPWQEPGGGIFVYGNIFIINSIVANNTTGGDCDYHYSGTLTSQGHNIDSDGSCQLTGPGDMPNTNPVLGPLQNNGGPTLTCALLVGSPAIDTAENTACPATDQRGVIRPQGTGCDIGAYEFDG